MKQNVTFREFAHSVSKARTAIMGIGILLVVAYHSGISFGPLTIVKNNGYAGVDLFVFLSGFGIWHSLQKEGKLTEFYKKRILRLYPSYLIVLALSFLTRYRVLRESYGKRQIVAAFLQNVFGIAFYTGQEPFNWYIFFILYMYLLSPLFYALVKRKKAYLLLIPYVLLVYFDGIGDGGKMMLYSRIPLYLLGMVFASKKEEESGIPFLVLLLTAVIGVIALPLTQTYLKDYLFTYGMYWYPFLIAVPGLCYFLACGLNRLSEGNILKRFLLLCGASSLEIYLLNVTFNDPAAIWLSGYIGWDIVWYPLTIATLILGILFHKGIAFLQKRLQALF